MEQIMATIRADLLQVDKVGVVDDLRTWSPFPAGAATVVTVSQNELFSAPTLRGLCVLAEGKIVSGLEKAGENQTAEALANLQRGGSAWSRGAHARRLRQRGGACDVLDDHDDGYIGAALDFPEPAPVSKVYVIALSHALYLSAHPPRMASAARCVGRGDVRGGAGQRPSDGCEATTGAAPWFGALLIARASITPRCGLS
jgi:hypothetical protein